MASSTRVRRSPAYSCVEQLLARDQCVILDGGDRDRAAGAEIPATDQRDEALWGTWALLNAPRRRARACTARYAEAGCDVISTEHLGPARRARTASARLGRLAARPLDGPGAPRRSGSPAQATAEVGRASDVRGRLQPQRRRRRAAGRRDVSSCSARAFEDEPPDLLLLETMSLVRDATFETVEPLLETGLPGVAQLPPLPPRRLRRLRRSTGAARRATSSAAPPAASRRWASSALLINCIPPDHVPGMLSWLRDFTDLPLGVYPNLGYCTESRLALRRPAIGGEEYAELALQLARGGRADRRRLLRRRPRAHRGGARARSPTPSPAPRVRRSPRAAPAPAEALRARRRPGRDEHGRAPLPAADCPDLMVEPGVFVPTPGSFLAWKHLFRSGIGEGKRCLDVGLRHRPAHRPARAQRRRARARDRHRRARGGQHALERVPQRRRRPRHRRRRGPLPVGRPRSATTSIVASLYQMPIDPFEQLTSHRPLDYWGRNLLDHLIALLPEALERRTASPT